LGKVQYPKVWLDMRAAKASDVKPASTQRGERET